MIRRVTFTPSLAITAYDTGDVLFETLLVPGALRQVGGIGRLAKSVVHDKADQKAEIKLIIFNADKALGTRHAAPDIVDADADYIRGIVRFETTDYHDLGGVAVAEVSATDGFALQSTFVEAVEETKGIYVAGIVIGTPTYAAASLVFDLWISDI